MKRIFAVFCAAAMLLVFAIAAAEDADLQAKYEMGMRQIAAGAYDEAYETFASLGHYSDSYEKMTALQSKDMGTLRKLNDHTARIECPITEDADTDEFDYDEEVPAIYGLINFETNTVVDPRWSGIKVYEDNRFAVRNWRDGKWGLCDDNGKMLVNYTWRAVSEDEIDGVFVIENGSKKIKKYGLADTDGKILSKCRWLTMGDMDNETTAGDIMVPSFPCGLIRVEDEFGNWGFMDKTGVLRIHAHYANATDFDEVNGLAQVTDVKGIKQYVFYIDTNNEEVYYEKKDAEGLSK